MDLWTRFRGTDNLNSQDLELMQAEELELDDDLLIREETVELDLEELDLMPEEKTIH